MKPSTALRGLVVAGLGLATLASPAAAQTPGQTYQQQQDQYQQQQQNYQNQNDQYQDQRDQYRHQRDRYQFERDHPAWWWRTRYDHASFGYFHHMRGDIAGTLVVERDGDTVGRIRRVAWGRDGDIQRVQIDLGDGRVAWMDADSLRYDPDDRIAFTSIPRGELMDRARNTGFEPRP